MILVTKNIRLCGGYGIFPGDKYISQGFFTIFYMKLEDVVLGEIPRDLVIGSLDLKEEINATESG